MKYKTVPGVILTKVCGEYFLVTPDEIIQANETAASCWKLLVNGVSEEKLSELMLEEYEAEDPEVLRSDITTLIQSLRQRRLIVRCGQ